MRDIEAVLNRWRFTDTDEHALQAGIDQALREAGYVPRREVILSPRDRIDFMIGHLGIEVKVAGTAATVIRQLRRYAAHPDIDSLMLVTTRVQLSALGGCSLSVPLRIVTIMRGIL